MMNAQLKQTDDEYGVALEDRTVRLERLLPGPIERVWTYLTDPEKRGKPGPATKCPRPPALSG